MPENVLAISNQDVLEVLTMPECIEAIEATYREWDTGDSAGSPRAEYASPTSRTSERYTFAVHDGVSRVAGMAALRVRSDVIVSRGDRDQKYCIEPGTYCGLIFLYDVENGAPLAMLHDAVVQQMRVAATAAVAAKSLARPDSSTLGIIGSGNQARTHADAYSTVLPIERIRCYSTSPENREKFAEEYSDRLGIEVTAVDSAREALEGSDVVAACTIANDPVFDASWLEPGTFVSSVRHWSEVGPDLLERADRIIVHQPPTLNWYVLGNDSEWDRALTPAGSQPTGSLAAMGEDRDRMVPTDGPLLVDVLAGREPGRIDDRESVYFLNNFGTGLQFAACGSVVYRKVRERGLGTPLPLELFVEDMRD